MFGWDDAALLNIQRRALLSAGVKKEKIVMDNLRSRLGERLQLEACLNTISTENTLVIWRLERLGNFRQQYNILKKLKEKDAGLQVLSGFDVSSEKEAIFEAFFSLAEQIGFKEKE